MFEENLWTFEKYISNLCPIILYMCKTMHLSQTTNFFSLTPLIIVGVTKGVVKGSHLTWCESFKLRCCVMGLGGGMVAHKVRRVILATPFISPQISQKIITMLQFFPFLSPMSLAVPSLLSLAIAAPKSSRALALSLSLFSLSFLSCVHSSSCAQEA